MIRVMVVNVRSDLNSSNLFITLSRQFEPLSPQHPCEQISGEKWTHLSLFLTLENHVSPLFIRPGAEGSEINGPAAKSQGARASRVEMKLYLLLSRLGSAKFISSARSMARVHSSFRSCRMHARNMCINLKCTAQALSAKRV
jgi:hypothetical protein